MKLDQLERARAYAINGFQEGEGHPLDPVDAEIEAMRTPITAEALKSHGWRETYRTEQYGGIWEFSPPEIYDNTSLWAYDIECNLDGSLRRAVDSRNRDLPGVRTMFDVGQLERLIGGEK